MDTGIGYFPTHDAVDPAAMARLVEERGHAALYFAEHTHIPAARTTPYPSGGELPRRYYHCHDLFVALTAAAAATTRLRVGSGVCLVIERDPIVTAKEVASVDALSGGRLDFGIGAGWNREEMANHGTDPRTRMRLMRERVEAMQAIWTQDEATYHGKHVNFDAIWSWPKPLQQPHPPVLLGGSGPKVLDRVLAYADVWTPNRFGSPEELGGRIEELRSRAGRHVPVIASGVKPERDFLAQLAEVGVDGCTFYVSPDADRGEVERQLDEFAALG
jgi:probable F420-dependent oxidoreductase